MTGGPVVDAVAAVRRMSTQSDEAIISQNDDNKQCRQAFSCGIDVLSTIEVGCVDSSVLSVEAYKTFSDSSEALGTDLLIDQLAYAGSGDIGIIPQKKKCSPKTRNHVFPRVSNNFLKAWTSKCGEVRPQNPSSAYKCVKAIEVTKGETETQGKLYKEVPQEVRCNVQTTKLTIDATQCKADEEGQTSPIRWPQFARCPPKAMRRSFLESRKASKVAKLSRSSSTTMLAAVLFLLSIIGVSHAQQVSLLF
jgi:hypothetical protein